MFIPVGLTAGYGFHDIRKKQVIGDENTNAGSTDHFQLRGPEIGLKLMLPVTSKWQVEVMGVRYFLNSELPDNQSRYMIRGMIRFSL